MTESESVPAVDAITDFGSMDVSQTGHNRYTVTNLKSGTITEVRLSDQPECDCEDFLYIPGESNGRNACKHILMANHIANQTIRAEEYALQQVAHNQREVRESVIEQERLLARLDRQATDNDASDADVRDAVEEAEDDGNGDGAEESTPDEVQKVYSWLDERGVSGGKVKVWLEDDEVVIESQEQLDDDEFAVLRDTDEIWYNGEHNYITEDNLREVLS